MPEGEKKRKKIVIEEVTEEKPSHQEPVPTAAPVEEPANPIPAPPQPLKEPRTFNLFFFFLILFFAFLITVFIGGLYVYFTGIKSKTATATPTPTASSDPVATPAVSDAPTASPSASNLGSFKVSVLNGSGKSGEAGRARALLEKAGFNVTSTGNASAFNFTDTTIQVKSTVGAEVVSKLKESLGESYSVTDGKALDVKSQFDIVITVGSKSS